MLNLLAITNYVRFSALSAHIQLDAGLASMIISGWTVPDLYSIPAMH